MKMAKASEKDINAAGDAMSVLQDISSGYYPKRDGDDCEDFRFDPEDPAHLRKFYELMSATLDASPGWPGRVIGGMCYVILFPANEILNPDADTLELHPQWVKRADSVVEVPASIAQCDGCNSPQVCASGEPCARGFVRHAPGVQVELSTRPLTSAAGSAALLEAVRNAPREPAQDISNDPPVDGMPVTGGQQHG